MRNPPGSNPTHPSEPPTRRNKTHGTPPENPALLYLGASHQRHERSLLPCLGSYSGGS
ncbi:MAG: hypothetical protein AAGE59_04070 [Cyanobacteria bacterium P01_F01_bin.86]